MNMRVTVILHNGRKIEISDVTTAMTWIDVAAILLDNNIIDENDFFEFEDDPRFRKPISGEETIFDFREGGPVNSNSSLKRRKKGLKKKLGSKKLGAPLPDAIPITEKEKIEAIRNPTYGSRKQSSPMKRKQSSPMKRKQSSPVNKMDPKVHPPTPMPKPPKSRRNIRHYEMDINCSTTGKEWTAKLLGLTPPSTHAPQTPKQNHTVGGSRTIYLCLDDSTSMYGLALTQLKQAVASFLSERPVEETINILTFNNTVTYTGSPSTAASRVAGMYATGSTPMARCLDRISPQYKSKTSGKESNDVTILFSDGDPDYPSNTKTAATNLKRSMKLITIGCGSSVNQNFLSSIASSSSDYHHADNPGQILGAFQQIARSLAQNPVVVGANNANKNASRAKQIGIGGNKSNNSNSNYQTSNQLKSNEGFDIIEDFNCGECGNNGRAVCVCGVPLCQGGLRNMGKGNLSQMTCPVCNVVFELQMVETLHATTRGGSGKKKN
jgi:uncharacterized protein YegL